MYYKNQLLIEYNLLYVYNFLLYCILALFSKPMFKKILV